MRKSDPNLQNGSAGFDYYLKELEKKREETGITIQLDLLRLLADKNGETQLFALISQYLGGDVTGDDWLDLTEKIKKMQKAGLITITQGQSSGAKNLKITLSKTGKQTLEAQGFRFK